MLNNVRLQEMRVKLKKTKREIANDLRIEESTYGKYELGKRQPDIGMLDKLADYFDCTADYLLGRTNSTETKVITELPKELIDAGIKGIEVFKNIKPSDLTLEDYKDILEAYAKINSRHA